MTEVYQGKHPHKGSKKPLFECYPVPKGDKPFKGSIDLRPKVVKKQVEDSESICKYEGL